MDNLYNYIEIIEVLNIVLMISILFICIALYKISKDLSYISIFLVYMVEIAVSFCITKYSYSNVSSSQELYMLSFIFIVKPAIFLLFVKHILFSVKLNVMIVILSVIAILSMSNGYEFSLIINLIINTLVINYGIINKIKVYNNELYMNRKKLKLNNKYITKTNHQIALEYDFQSQYKDEISILNNKVSKSIEEVDTPVFVLDKDQKFIYSNKCFENMLQEDGVNQSNLNINEYIKNKFINSDELSNIFKKSNIENGNIANLNTFDDKIFRFTCATDIVNGKGIIYCILNDITQSTLIQNKLKESEERYRNLMDILTDGVIIHNNNTISYINNRAIDLFRLDESINKVWLIDDLNIKLNKKFRKGFLNNINLVQHGKEDKTSVKIETEEGKIIEFVTTSITLNERRMMISLAIDITTMEQAMIELEQSEKTYKLLLQTLPEGIVIIDKKTNNYIYRNKAMIKLLKNIGSDNLNKVVNDYIKKKEYGRFKKITINENERCDISIAIIDMVEDGNYLVVVRNLENAQKIVKIAEKLSEIKAKYKFKTEFLASVTKDIKKPINIISNTNNILDISKDKYGSNNITNYTRLVRQNCNRLIRILNNIEEIEAIENNKYKMNYSKVNIIKLVSNIVNLSSSYTNEKGLNINFKSNMRNKNLYLDKEKIEKVLLNILANAIKFTDTGGTINVEVNVISEEVHISIRDSGVGIPQDKIGLIFEDFEQVDRTLSRGAEGTGIGLALAKKLVDLHQGKISVSSQMGVGSDFEVILRDNENEYKHQMITIYDDFIDKEKIDIEFSDIYLNLN